MISPHSHSFGASPAGQFPTARASSRLRCSARREGYFISYLPLGVARPLSFSRSRLSPCGISLLRTGRFEWPSRDQTGASS